MFRYIRLPVLFVLVMAVGTPAMALDDSSQSEPTPIGEDSWLIAQDQLRDRDRDRDRIHVDGMQFLSEQERLRYRQRLRAARTDSERAAIHAEYRAIQRARARARGVTLPQDVAPDRDRDRDRARDRDRDRDRTHQSRSGSMRG